MRRVVVVGGPGSGKSTVVAVVADRLNAPHLELDKLWWEPGWTPAGRDRLRQLLTEHLAADRWVVDGFYVDEIADLAWPLADTIVWLDLPRRMAARRAVLRSLRRATRGTALWNGNREPPSVLSPFAISRLVRRWPSYSERIAKALVDLDVPDHTVARLRSDPEVARWLQAI